MTTYQIRRFRVDAEAETIRTGLTLEEARAWCARPDTHGEGWFDGYDAEEGTDPVWWDELADRLAHCDECGCAHDPADDDNRDPACTCPCHPTRDGEGKLAAVREGWTQFFEEDGTR